MRNSLPETGARDDCIRLKGGLLLAFALFAFPRITLAASSPSANSNAPAAISVTNAVALHLTDIPAQAESVTASLQTINADLAADDATKTIQRELPSLTDEIAARAEETSRIISSGSSFEMIRRLHGNWQECS